MSPPPVAPLLAPHIAVSDLTVRYGRRDALAGVDLEFGVGVHGLLGPNGAGKSTLMRVLATVANPTAGAVAVRGYSVADRRSVREVRRRLGYLPQTFGHYPRFTVREFMEYFAWLKEVPARRVSTEVGRALERVGLLERADDRMKTLSGGMRQRVGIAQAIVNDPDVLLLDEPTVGLDPEQRVALRTLLRELGVDACVLVSTHLVEDVAAACADVTMFSEGRRLFSGTPAELAAAAVDGADGDSPLERGYSSVLRAASPGVTGWRR